MALQKQFATLLPKPGSKTRNYLAIIPGKIHKARLDLDTTDLTENISTANQSMNTRSILKPVGAAIVSILTVGISPDAKGIAFQNLTQLPAGVSYVFKLSNFDEGALYATQPLNGEIGATNNPAAGVALMDAQEVLSPVNAHNTGGIAGLGGSVREDTWGTAIIQQIFRSDNLVMPVWSAAADQQQLTMMFYGAQDFYGKQTSLGLAPGPQDDSMTIASRGLQIDVYLENTANPFTSYNALALGPGGRPADLAVINGANDASYTSVTDSNVFGNQPVLTMRTTPGFLRGAGDLGGLATEFEVTVNGAADNLASSGAAFMSVGPTLGGVGVLNHLWDTNGFSAPHIAGNTADFSMQFTATVDGSGPWLLSSQDPVRGYVIPEPTTALTGIGCMLPILMGALGRRRKSAVVAGI